MFVHIIDLEPQAEPEQLTMTEHYERYVTKFSQLEPTDGVTSRFKPKKHLAWSRPNLVSKLEEEATEVDETGTEYTEGPLGFRIREESFKLVFDSHSTEAHLQVNLLAPSTVDASPTTVKKVKKTMRKLEIDGDRIAEVDNSADDTFEEFVEPKDVAMEDVPAPKEEAEAPDNSTEEVKTVEVADANIEDVKDSLAKSTDDLEPEVKEDVEMKEDS
jgi:hypothetical protein